MNPHLECPVKGLMNNSGFQGEGKEVYKEIMEGGTRIKQLRYRQGYLCE